MTIGWEIYVPGQPLIRPMSVQLDDKTWWIAGGYSKNPKSSRYSPHTGFVRINCEEGKTQALNKVMAQVQLAQCIERSIEISKS